MKKYNYNTTDYNFREKIQKIFGEYQLENLIDDSISGILTREKDQNSKYHHLFYKWTKTDEFRNIYVEFIENVILSINAILKVGIV